MSARTCLLRGGERAIAGAAALALTLCLLTASARCQERGSRWQDPESILLSDPPTRERAIKQLKLGPGEWHVAVVTMTPGGDSAKTVEALKSDPRAVVLVAAPRDVVNKWKAEAGIKRRVVSVSPQLTYDLGIFYLPTVVRVVDGRVTGARRR